MFNKTSLNSHLCPTITVMPLSVNFPSLNNKTSNLCQKYGLKTHMKTHPALLPVSIQAFYAALALAI